MSALRDYQAQALTDLRRSVAAGHRAPVLVSPTGSGKTVIAKALIESAANKGRSVLFLAPRRELIFQTCEKLDAAGVDFGVIMAGQQPRRWAAVQVACIPSILARWTRGERLPEADLICVDEAHLSIADGTQRVLAAYPDAVKIGLTATPARTDGRGLGAVYDDLVMGPTVAWLTQHGHLVPARYFAPSKPDLVGVRMQAGDYNQKQLGERMAPLVGDVVTNWLRIAPDRKTVVFSVNVAHSQALREQFTAAGVRAEHLDGTTPNDERAAILRRVHSGETQVLTNCDVATYGWDCLDMETEILTPDGWLGPSEVQLAGTCYALNRETGRIEAAPIIDTGSRIVRVDEQMLAIESQHMNIRTTEGHCFYIKKRSGATIGSRYAKATAAEIASRTASFFLPVSGEAEFAGVPLTDDELRFLAWLMTDGYVSARGAAFIVQSKRDTTERIRSLLTRLGFDFSVRSRIQKGYKPGSVVYEFRIPRGTHSGSMKRRGWAGLERYFSKELSPRLMSMTSKQFEVFWDELLLGDGERQGKRSGWLWCNNKALADRLMQMAVLRGRSTSVNVRVTENGVRMYRVGANRKRFIEVQPSSRRPPRISLTDAQGGERVWCVTNHLGTIIIRRRGKVAIVGNCPPISCAVLARPTKSLPRYFQMVGRVLRPYAGKTNCLVIDHGGTVDEFGFVDEPVEWKLDADGKVQERGRFEKRKKSKITCADCATVYSGCRTCPHCGYEPPARLAKAIECIDDDLAELDRQKKRSNRDWTNEQKSEFYGELKHYCRTRGYSEGWASNKYRERFGVWPNAHKWAEPREPTPETLSWIRSRQIAWAKSKQRHKVAA